jgi:ElaA protein
VSDDAATDVVHVARWRDLDPTTAYGILRLRSRVFVVEQRCAYLDPDGHDLEPEALQLWIEVDGRVVSGLRVVRVDATTQKIGRVATDPDHRRRGLGEAVMRKALSICSGEVALNAQSHLQAWYERLGFAVDGEPWSEDGIPHVPMRLVR